MAIETIPEDSPQPEQSSFADILPEEASGFSGDSFPDAPETAVPEGGVIMAGGDAEPPRKRVGMSKQMKKGIQKMMKQISEMPGTYFDNMATSNPEWALTKDEKETLSDSVSFVFEILDIGFDIEPVGIKLTSIWWIIAYPFFVFGFIFLNKKQKIDAQATEPKP